MRVRLLAPAILRRFGARTIEDVVEVPDDQAQDFINAGVAIRVGGKPAPKVEPDPEPEPPVVETAEVAPAENAAIRAEKPVPRKKGQKKESK